MSDTIEAVPTALIGAESSTLAPVLRLIDQHPDLALAIRSAIDQRIRETACPPLIPVQITDDGETYAGIRCPWCGADVENSETLGVLDTSDRTTIVAADEFDHEHRSISPVYDERSDYDGLCYVHEGCGNPVALPTGWTERG